MNHHILLITFDSWIDVLHKQKTKVETWTSQHEEEPKWNNWHVPKVERGLEHPTHSTSVEVIEEGVSVDEQTRHSSIDKCAPPPSVVLPGQLEVKQCHTDEGCDNQKQNEGEEKNSK